MKMETEYRTRTRLEPRHSTKLKTSLIFILPHIPCEKQRLTPTPIPTSIPITAPNKRLTPPLCVLLLRPRRADGPRTHPEGAAAVEAAFLRQHADAGLVVAFAAGRGGFGEESGPGLFADDGVVDELLVGDGGGAGGGWGGG